MTVSWIWSISMGVGKTGIWLSYRYREPIITAWPTPGVAFLVSALSVTPPEDIGTYIICSRIYAFRIIGHARTFRSAYSPGIASGLIAGILLHFGNLAFGGAKVDPLLVVVLFAAYILLRRFTYRYAIVGILAIGLIYLIGKGKSGFQYDPIADCINRYLSFRSFHYMLH